MDAAWLKANVGSVLAAGLAHTVQMQPDDPVAFLAQYLLAADAKKSAAAEAALLRERAEKANADKAEAARTLKLLEDKKAEAARIASEGIVAALDEALGQVRCAGQRKLRLLLAG
jgi:hypothetical protein